MFMKEKEFYQDMDLIFHYVYVQLNNIDICTCSDSV